MTTTHLDLPLTDNQRHLLGLTIPQALDWAAEKFADKTAFSMVDAPGALTYHRLHDLVGRLRTGLTTLGLTPGERVGIMIANRLEFPLAWLSVIDAGAVAVPLNPKYTTREVDFVLTDAGATWLITTEHLIDTHADSEAFQTIPDDHRIVIGGNPESATSFENLATTERQPRTHHAQPDDLIGIQFTSGSTGLPKGCMLTHHYWLALGAYGAALFSDPQHLLADHPFYYMQNQAYFMCALPGGGELHITPGLSRRKFMRWLTDYAIDFAWIDETMLDYDDTATAEGLALKRAPTAALPADLHKALEERFDLQAREWYASTEIGSGTFAPWDRVDLVGSGTMGLALPNRETRVVDPTFTDTAPGEPGELLIRGPGMMLGYWNRPEANAELFLPGGWFRTGDIVRKDADGLHYYIGRIRDSIRRSGENIAAVEVEQQIATLPGVSAVAVVPVPDPDRGEEVKAIIVTRPGAELTATQVLDWARERLARFKVPRYVEFRTELPYTGSGKIAKAVLRKEPNPVNASVFDATRQP